MRRRFVGVLSFLALIGIVAIGATSGSAQDTSVPDHPILGAWELRADLGAGETSCLSHVVFTADGGYVDVDCDGHVQVGVWEPTGPNTANLMITVKSVEMGSFIIRAAFEVSADGQTFTAPFTFELLDPTTGEGSGQYGPGLATGTRLVAEGPGTPIAPVADLFADTEASPEATPAA